jgi:hypothetical protein
MTVVVSITEGINSRQFMLIEYTDVGGRPHADVLEGYTLGLDHSNQQILKGFHWASYPGPWYSKGGRTYPVERITAVELTGHKFSRPQDEAGAKDSSEFKSIICDYYFPGWRV